MPGFTRVAEMLAVQLHVTAHRLEDGLRLDMRDALLQNRFQKLQLGRIACAADK